MTGLENGRRCGRCGELVSADEIRVNLAGANPGDDQPNNNSTEAKNQPAPQQCRYGSECIKVSGGNLHRLIVEMSNSVVDLKSAFMFAKTVGGF